MAAMARLRALADLYLHRRGALQVVTSDPNLPDATSLTTFCE